MSDELTMPRVLYDLKQGSATLSAIMSIGAEALSGDPDLVSRAIAELDEVALASLIYTSGTTGIPKGVMLNQRGWIGSVLNTLPQTGFRIGDRALSLVPPWHAFKRGVKYAVVYLGLA